ncbi:alanine racemase [Virgibacillus ihumii]|uniref:alanine racemase n=1 Tax=Virgibacillus ihumii TaxID=2686091 RepID=UPI00157DA874|nr:alanine racemase [Virgibacillus ihumii]
MFLDVTKRRNPQLIQEGVSLHQAGDIPPNTYVIDVDTLKENTSKLATAAAENGMDLYFMSKQLRRIPKLADIIVESGIKKAVAVDFDEGKVLADHGIAIGNIGHLVQPGKHQWKEVLGWNPEVVTVFSFERARQVSETAESLGKCQDILLKVTSYEDKCYEGQEGGILLKDLPETVDKIKSLTGVTIVGVTTFPNLELNEQKTTMIPTNNFHTLLQAKKVLTDKGIYIKQVNGPSGTSCETIPYLAKNGITHSEPGHGLTGTTPLHAYADLPEKPATVYVTEVSHEYNGNCQVIAGGYYGRSRMKGCLVGSDKESILKQFTKAYQNNPETIDYYGTIENTNNFTIKTGDTAVFAFRSQIFVTRAHVALVEGVQTGNPKVIHFERNW